MTFPFFIQVLISHCSKCLTARAKTGSQRAIPKGDCEGLYVSNETPQGFEVHELRHGQSSIAFDYRIMAKRKGYENVRLADVTAKMRIPSGPRGSKIQRQSLPTRVPAPKLSAFTNPSGPRLESQVGRSLMGK